MGHIFISYSKKDIVYAEKLINLATVTTRRKKASYKVDSVRLTEAARKQKVESAAQKASYYLSKFTNNVKDVIAVASKISSDTYKTVANSAAVKELSSRVKGTTKPVRKKKNKIRVK